MRAHIIFLLLSLWLIASCDNQDNNLERETNTKAAMPTEVSIEAMPQVIEPEKLASLCRQNEIAYLNTKLQVVTVNADSDSLYQLENSKQIASLCFIENAEPQFAFRYGTAGHVEFEAFATETSPFGTYFRRIGKVTENMVFFKDQEIDYYIIESGGMGSGVSLKIFNGDQLQKEYFSGTDHGADFELSDFVPPLSLLEGQEPPHEIMY